MRKFVLSVGIVARYVLLLMGSFLSLLLSGSAFAAILAVDNGELIGALGVDVGGTLYSVEFLDGTCVEVFSGCDDASDFEFNTSAAALQAAQALLDQVFTDSGLGLFDTDANLTRGIDSGTSPSSGEFYHPYAVGEPGFPPGTWVSIASTYNSHTEAFDQLMNYGPVFGPTWTTAAPPNTDGGAWARWSLVTIPEPSTALLLGLGLVGLAVRRRS